MESASPSFSVSNLPTTMASDIDQRNGIPTIRFTNIEDLFKAVGQVQGDFLIVQKVPLSDFEELCLREKRPFRIRRYHASEGILIVTIPTELHESLHLDLHRIYDHKLFRNGQARGWKAIGSTTFRPRGHPGGDGGEGDSSGGPKPTRHAIGAWPTLVIEAGDSESLSALQDDMRWWFSASDHDVKIVLLTKFDHQNQRIIIERWEEESQNLQGATNTRRVTSGNTLQPVLRQSIVITRDIPTDSYHVTRGALVLSFRLLFLRDPGPQESDYIISITELQDYARDVWVYV
ncbi:hypothetical protein F5Y00DRAFT_152756 [Daldinia vernicosa]|uniref:uncharacterized protein n=1 Tax=Daldinia vernicosa TaxID=114800 RepID=UPI0020084736|nr:uncharacterized protein F5Y00DRAFT_152756 [Daldinia vernicosa]KAI0845975.1 hypothetical protein F5Y00DRAFT_152756 [Daldinia vernicosa]